MTRAAPGRGGMPAAVLVAGLAALSAGVTLLAAGSAEAALRQKFALRFDLLTPAGMACTAEAPGAVVRDTTSIFGRPFLTILGDLSQARITCAAPDGSLWRTDLPFAGKPGRGPSFDGVAAWRPGASRMYLYVTTGADSSARVAAPGIYRFTRLRGADPDPKD